MPNCSTAPAPSAPASSRWSRRKRRKVTALADGPCGGLKVLDLTTVVAGPMCGRILGDLGADVVKLESLDGDMLRLFPPQYRGMSGYFMQMNRNKRSVAIDLKTERGRTLARELAAKADIFIENFVPGSLLGSGSTMRPCEPAMAARSIPRSSAGAT